MKIVVELNKIIPEGIVEVSNFVNSANLLNKTVEFEDKGLYNKIQNIVLYYNTKSSDKNCCKKYKELKELIPSINPIIAKYRLAITEASHGGHNPYMQAPLMLDIR